MHYWICRSRQSTERLFDREILLLGAFISLSAILSLQFHAGFLRVFTCLAAVVYLFYFFLVCAGKWYGRIHFELREGRFIQQGCFIYHFVSYHDIPFDMMKKYGITLCQNRLEVKISGEKPEYVFPASAVRLVRIQSVDSITKKKSGYVIRGRCKRYRPYSWSDRTYPYTAHLYDKEIDYIWTLVDKFKSVQDFRKGR